jgi:hypothetical protein
VQDLTGRRWRVTRRWTKAVGETPGRRFRRRAGSSFGRMGDVADVGRLGAMLGDLAEIPVIGIVFAVLALAFLAVFAVLVVALVIVPLLFAVVELTVLLLLAGLAVGGRLVVRHPWTVVAEADDGTVHRWPVVGWRASRRRRDEVADLLAAGIVAPGGAPGVAAPGAPGASGAPAPG